MNKIRVLFFATFKEHTNTKETSVILNDDASVKDLKEEIIEKYPSLLQLINSALIAVNRQYAFDEDIIPNDAEVAIFPPVSGGVSEFPTILAITEDEIKQADVLQKITQTTTGAVCTFIGVVRGVTEHKDPHNTIYLEYDAYKPMAEAKLLQIATEIRTRWPYVEGIAIVQRIGSIYPQTPTVLVACSSAHRDTGVFEAVRYGIDRLKEIVPIWKKEISSRGEEWVEGDYRPEPEE
jgi:molybdopterin converting factor subunit 1